MSTLNLFNSHEFGDLTWCIPLQKEKLRKGKEDLSQPFSRCKQMLLSYTVKSGNTIDHI